MRWSRWYGALGLLVAVLCPGRVRAQDMQAQDEGAAEAARKLPAMFFSDTSRLGVPFAKDPSVIEFRGRYLLYYSLPPRRDVKADDHGEQTGWGIGIAESRDLLHWSNRWSAGALRRRARG